MPRKRQATRGQILQDLILAARHPDLSPSAKMVLIVIAAHTRKHQSSWPGASLIAKEAGYEDRRSVQRVIKRLAALDILHIDRRKRAQNVNLSNRYRISVKALCALCDDAELVERVVAWQHAKQTHPVGQETDRVSVGEPTPVGQETDRVSVGESHEVLRTSNEESDPEVALSEDESPAAAAAPLTREQPVGEGKGGGMAHPIPCFNGHLPPPDLTEPEETAEDVLADLMKGVFNGR